MSPTPPPVPPRPEYLPGYAAPPVPAPPPAHAPWPPPGFAPGAFVPQGFVPEGFVPPPAPPQQGWAVHWVGLVALLPFAASCYFWAYPVAMERGKGEAFAQFATFLFVMMGVGAATVGSLAAWAVLGRSRAVATVVFVAALAVVAGLGPASRRAAGQARQAGATRGAVDRAVDAIDEVQADGKASLLRLKRGVSLLDLHGLDSRQEIDRRLESVDAIVKTFRDARRKSEAARSQLRQDLAALGVPAERQGPWLADCDRRVDWAVFLETCDKSETFALRGRDVLRYLGNTWGIWRLNGGDCEFDDPQILARYNELVAGLQGAQADLVATIERAKANRKSPASASAQ